jgi:hypothetical protein
VAFDHLSVFEAERLRRPVVPSPERRKTVKQRLAGILMALLPGVAWGASEEAWEEFRAAVDQSCRALVEAPAQASVAVEVSPFGSESYGAALVTVGYAERKDRMICIYDKATAKAELTAPFVDAAATQ